MMTLGISHAVQIVKKSPDVPVLLPFGILPQPVQGWRPAPGGWSVTPHSFYSSIRIILHLLK